MHEAVDRLENPEQRPAAEVRARYARWVHDFSKRLKTPVGEAIRHWGQHFVKITRSYWPGLFQTYDIDGLPRTNNDLEHLFGSLRHQERRITGHKVVSPSLIVRGAVRVLAAVITWANPLSPQQLGEVDLVAWHEERHQLDKLRDGRRLQRHFRQHPETYLAALEKRLLKLDLPP